MSKAMCQMPARAGRVGDTRGETASEPVSDEADGPRHEPNDTGNPDAALLHAAFTRENLQRAFKRVRANKGAAGVDGLDINQTAKHLITAWPAIREQLLAGTYRPSPVRRVAILKPDGRERELGIPTVTDRLIQHALLQMLQPILDPSFSEHSYGFRPGRRAQGAVLAAQAYVQSGRKVVVDVDLEKFFDRVNHDILIDRLSKRYADDANVYVGSRRAGERVMALLWRLYGKLKLTINEAKSAAAGVFGRKFLGDSLWVARGQVVKRRVADKPLETFKQRVRQLTRRSGGRSMTQVVEGLRPYLLGWKAYFGLAQTPGVWRELDEGLRHRLRAIQLKHWRRGTTIYRELRALGTTPEVARPVAANSCRWWRNSAMLLNCVLTIAWFDRMGLPRLS